LPTSSEATINLLKKHYSKIKGLEIELSQEKETNRRLRKQVRKLENKQRVKG